MPPEKLKALAKVAEHVRLPVATGERIHSRFEFRELFELQAGDIVPPTSRTSAGSSRPARSPPPRGPTTR